MKDDDFDYTYFVSGLNERYYDQNFFINSGAPYEIRSDGYDFLIKFLGYNVWSSVDDRLYDDNDIPVDIENVVRKRSLDIVDNISYVLHLKYKKKIMDNGE